MAEKVIDVPSVKVEGWALPEMPCKLITKKIYAHKTEVSGRG